MRILIVYASKHGQTAKIADRIEQSMRAAGASPVVVDVRNINPTLDLRIFEAVVLAAPVYYGKFPRVVTKFVVRNLAALKSVRSAFVAVSLAAAFDRTEAENQLHNFVGRTGWLPETYFNVGGAEAFAKYGWFTKRIMKKIATEHGRGGDFTKDREYTDWQALDTFVAEFVAKLRAITSSAVATPL